MLENIHMPKYERSGVIRRVKKIAGITQKGTYLEGTRSLLQISAVPLPHNVSMYYVYTSELQASSFQYYLGDGTMENKYAINHLQPAQQCPVHT